MGRMGFNTGNEAHTLFYGVPKSGFWGGGQKVYVEKVYVLFPQWV